MGKKNNILIAILVIIGIVVITTSVLLIFGNSEDKNNNNSNNILYACFSSEYGIMTLVYNKDECKGDIEGQINTKTKNPKVIDFARYYGNTLSGVNILVDDNGLKVYNTSNNEVTNIDLDNSYTEYNVVTYNDFSPNKISGITFSNNGKYTYFDVATLKTFNLPDNYVDCRGIVGNEYLAVTVDRTALSPNGYPCSQEVLYSIDDGKMIFENEVSNTCDIYFDALKYGNKYYYRKTFGLWDNNVIIYSNEMKKIIENTSYTITSNGYLYSYNKTNNELTEYNIDGKLTMVTKDYDKIHILSNDYALFTNNNELKLINLVNEEIVKLVDWNKDYKIIDKLSFYRSGSSLVNIVDKNGNQREEGFYIVLEKDNVYTEYYYNPSTKKVSKKLIGSAIPEESGICGLDYEFAYCD